MRKFTAKNKGCSRYLLKLNIAGVSCGFVLSQEYSPAFIQTLKTRYKFFSGENKPAKQVFIYEGLPNKYAFDTFVRLTYSALMLGNNGFLLHASAVISKGKGYIFTGVSGAGKTTVAEASRRAGIVLSDEIIAIRKIGKTWCLFGTPFMGLMRGGGTNRSAKNPRLLFLEQAPQNALKEITLEKAWGKFLRNIILFKPEKKNRRPEF